MEDMLEKATHSFDRRDPGNEWPNFLYPLADPVELADIEDRTLDILFKRIEDLAVLVNLALQQLPEKAAPAVPIAAKPMLDSRDAWFVVRCVFESPDCGPLRPPVVSAATEPFQMAGFFDPDAPARPIRIALPLDTSPAGLRKFDKNTAFMMSDLLCGQMERMKGVSLGDLVRSVLPWPLHKDLSVPDTGPCKNEAGTMCTLSIPIITICAMLLLMIIVNLLDIIFRWVPYFKMCFPIPGLLAKKS
jgi:hypothetical protein